MSSSLNIPMTFRNSMKNGVVHGESYKLPLTPDPLHADKHLDSPHKWIELVGM